MSLEYANFAVLLLVSAGGPELMLVWLGEVLRLDELHRARSFLGGVAEEARS